MLAALLPDKAWRFEKPSGGEASVTLQITLSAI